MGLLTCGRWNGIGRGCGGDLFGSCDNTQAGNNEGLGQRVTGEMTVGDSRPLGLWKDTGCVFLPLVTPPFPTLSLPGVSPLQSPVPCFPGPNSVRESSGDLGGEKAAWHLVY
jgi:hypothetical protein